MSMSNHTDQLMLDLFTTAIEGGVNYWASVSGYHWEKDGQDDLMGFWADLHDEENDGAGYHVNRRIIVRGYREATSAKWRGRLGWSSEKPPFIVDEDGWDFDAGDADMI